MATGTCPWEPSITLERRPLASWGTPLIPWTKLCKPWIGDPPRATGRVKEPRSALVLHACFLSYHSAPYPTRLLAIPPPTIAQLLRTTSLSPRTFSPGLRQQNICAGLAADPPRMFQRELRIRMISVPQPPTPTCPPQQQVQNWRREASDEERLRVGVSRGFGT